MVQASRSTQPETRGQPRRSVDDYPVRPQWCLSSERNPRRCPRVGWDEASGAEVTSTIWRVAELLGISTRDRMNLRRKVAKSAQVPDQD